ncbi:MAG: hypothetical protein L0Y44_15375 [Phycisphaerales bacterium]|nr:hypothetical protein [Phycisphaerales bacterium]
MLRYIPGFRGGWTAAADLIIKGLEGATSGGAAKTVTYDFERLMPGSTKLKCSEFADAIIKHMGHQPEAPARDAKSKPAMAGA